jgi:hypothetical protein
MTMSPLRLVKIVHTVIWTFFASCIIAIPLLARSGRFGAAAWLTGIVMIEVLVLVFNAWRCPLTAVAARHTDDRRANFDIYLPETLARHNKLVFGTLYAGGVLYTVARWLART